jgi:hypothetical protein
MSGNFSQGWAMTGWLLILTAGGLAGLVLGLLLQTVLLQAALALADVREVWFGKSFLLVVLALLLVAPPCGLALYLLGLSGPLAGTSLGVALVVGLCLLLSWALPTLIYVLLLPVPLRKGMLVAVLELLLRALVGALAAAVGLVGLAILQIVFTHTEPTPQALRGRPACLAVTDKGPVTWAASPARLP